MSTSLARAPGARRSQISLLRLTGMSPNYVCVACFLFLPVEFPSELSSLKYIEASASKFFSGMLSWFALWSPRTVSWGSEHGRPFWRYRAHFSGQTRSSGRHCESEKRHTTSLDRSCLLFVLTSYSYRIRTCCASVASKARSSA